MMSEGSPEQPVSGEGEAVRRKVPITKIKSCAECRRLKLKCDRNVPCSSCVRRGTTALCPHGALKTTKGAARTASKEAALQQRIASLESTIARMTSPETSRHSRTPMTPSVDATNVGPPSHNTQITPTGDAGIFGESSHRRAGDSQKQADPSETVEGDAGHLQMDKDGMRSSRFFGDASSLFLAESRKDGLYQDPSSWDRNYVFRPGWVESFVFERDSALRLGHSVQSLAAQLPQQMEAQRLAKLYYENVGWGTSIILRQSFDEDIITSVYLRKQLHNQRLAILYLVMALGALFDPSLPAGAQNNPYSKDLFALARACLSLDSSATIEFAQALHLMVTWMNNGGSPVAYNPATWPLLGMAMRVVQALGLHRDGSHFNLPKDETEKRRRVFWEVFSYDIIHAVTSGRPRSMTEATYDVQYPQTPEDGDTYHEARHQLNGRILCQVNDQQVTIKRPPYENTLRIDRELRQFQQNLPSELHVEDGHPPASLKGLQYHAMRFQCTLSFLLLHREWFVKSLLDEVPEPLQSQYSLSYIGCLEACKMMLGIVRRLAADWPIVCHRRWFFHFNAFTACVCLAAAVIRAPQSMLAQSSLLALEDGLRLFEEAGKVSEKEILRPLCETARRRLGRSGKLDPLTDDDLRLLGKNKDLRDLSLLSQTAIAVRETSSARNTPISSPFQGMPNGGASMATGFTDAQDSNKAGGDTVFPGPQSVDTGMPGEAGWYNINDFDFDAFVSSLGLGDIFEIPGE